MKIRSELNTLAANIQSAAMSWNGDEKILVGQTETTVAQIAQKFLDQLNNYQIEEKSLKGRIETLQNLLTAFNELRNKSPNPDKEKDLISILRKTNHIISSTTQTQKDIENKVSKEIKKKISDSLQYDYIDSDKARITQNAFRLIKNLNSLDQEFANNWVNGLNGSIQKASFLSLKRDLEQFLTSYSGLLTDKQRSKITEVIPLLQSGAEMHGKIYTLLSLFTLNKAPNDFIESQIADLAYELEKSIDRLEKGKSILIPGGCTGHAILYQLQRTREDKYEFSIFNTGYGNEFGQVFFGNIAPNQFRVPSFADLPKEAVADQNFLMDLIRFKAKPGFAMDPVHKRIVNQFVEKHHKVQGIRDFHDSQTWGTCSFDSVAAFLEYYMPPSLFIPFQYDMMLKARGELNALLPKGKADKIFEHQTIDFIHEKSCETLAEWKNKFEAHCNLKEDWLIAKEFLASGKVNDESSLKSEIEAWSDEVFDLDKVTHKLDAVRISFGGGVGLIAVSAALAGGPVGIGIAMGIAWYPALCAFGSDKMVWNQTMSDVFSKRDMYSASMKVIEKIIEKTSPEQAQIIKNRFQTLTPSTSTLDPIYEIFSNPKNRPVLNDLDLSGVFRYLQDRYSEITLCIPSLLNSSFSPLHEALQGCKMLPGSP